MELWVSSELFVLRVHATMGGRGCKAGREVFGLLEPKQLQKLQNFHDCALRLLLTLHLPLQD
jgi:hypothetical protein